MNKFKEMFNKTKNILIFVLVLTIYFSFSSLIVLGLKQLNIDLKALSIVPKTISMILIQSVLVFILYLIYRKEINNEFHDYKRNFNYYFKLGLKFWVIGLAIMLISNIILSFIVPNGPTNENAVQKALKEYPVYIVISTCLFAPFTEEIIFRKSLKKCFKDSFIFIVASGVLFGGLHVISSSTPLGFLYIIPYGTFGVIFAYLYAKTDNIFSTITIHMIHNTMLVMASLISSGVI